MFENVSGRLNVFLSDTMKDINDAEFSNICQQLLEENIENAQKLLSLSDEDCKLFSEVCKYELLIRNLFEYNKDNYKYDVSAYMEALIKACSSTDELIEMAISTQRAHFVCESFFTQIDNAYNEEKSRLAEEFDLSVSRIFLSNSAYQNALDSGDRETVSSLMNSSEEYQELQQKYNEDLSELNKKYWQQRDIIRNSEEYKKADEDYNNKFNALENVKANKLVSLMKSDYGISLDDYGHGIVQLLGWQDRVNQLKNALGDKIPSININVDWENYDSVQSRYYDLLSKIQILYLQGEFSDDLGYFPGTVNTNDDYEKLMPIFNKLTCAMECYQQLIVLGDNNKVVMELITKLTNELETGLNEISDEKWKEYEGGYEQYKQSMKTQEYIHWSAERHVYCGW